VSPSKDRILTFFSLFSRFFFAFKFYCDKNYNGDYTVNAERMLPYFENLVFLRTSRKFVIPDIGYEGVIGLKPAGWRPPNPRNRGAAKKTQEIEEWIPESSPFQLDQQMWTCDDAEAAIARSEELDQEGEGDHETAPVPMAGPENIPISDCTEDDNNSVEITPQEELQALHTMVEDEDEVGLALEGEDFSSGGQQELGYGAGAETPAKPHIIETEDDKLKGMFK